MSEQEQTSTDSSEEVNVSESDVVETNEVVDQDTTEDDGIPTLDDFQKLEAKVKNQDEAFERITAQREENDTLLAKYETILKSYGVEDPRSEAEFVAGKVEIKDGKTEGELRYRPETSPKLRVGKKIESAPKQSAPTEIVTTFTKGRMGVPKNE